MEPIIKVTVKIESQSGYSDWEYHYFHSIEQAKRWCEHDAQQVIMWESVKHVNPFTFWSDVIQLNGDRVTYSMEPIKITVMDEDDG